MATLWLFAGHFGALAIALGLAYLLGSLLTTRLQHPDLAGALFINTSVGLGAFTQVTFTVALVGLLSGPVVVAALVAIPIGWIWANRATLHPPPMGGGLGRWPAGKRSPGWRRLIGPCLAALACAPLLIPALYPPEKFDGISYHLPYAAFYLANHGLKVQPYLRFPLYSHNYELLFSDAMLLKDDLLAQMLHGSAAVLTALGTWHLGNRTLGPRVGALAAAMILGSPVVTDLMGTAYIDLGLMLFVFLSFYATFTWDVAEGGPSRDERWLILAGSAAGIAAGCKYSGILLGSLLALWVLMTSRKRGPFLKFAVPFLVLGVPWYLRSFLISGDPFSPFGGKVFGYWVWNAADLASQQAELLSHGSPRTVASLLELPFNLIVHPALFTEGPISPAVLLCFGAPAALWILPPAYRRLTLFVFTSVILWFFSTQILRYLLPTLPMMCLLAAAVAMGLWDRALAALGAGAESGGFWGWLKGPWLPLGASLVLVAPTYVRLARNVKFDPPPATPEAREQRLASHLPFYPFLQIARQWPELTIYRLRFEDSAYYAPGKIIGDWYGPARFSEVEPYLKSPAQLHAKLEELGAGLFLAEDSAFDFHYDASFDPYFSRIAENAHGGLYRLR